MSNQMLPEIDDVSSGSDPLRNSVSLDFCRLVSPPPSLAGLVSRARLVPGLNRSGTPSSASSSPLAKLSCSASLSLSSPVRSMTAELVMSGGGTDDARRGFLALMDRHLVSGVPVVRGSSGPGVTKMPVEALGLGGGVGALISRISSSSASRSMTSTWRHTPPSKTETDAPSERARLSKWPGSYSGS